MGVKRERETERETERDYKKIKGGGYGELMNLVSLLELTFKRKKHLIDEIISSSSSSNTT